MPLTVDCNFPGGNILVDAINGATVRLRQDLRDTKEDWFYWHFRVRGAAGRTVRFEFTTGDVFSAGGPCFRAGETGDDWRWLGRETLDPQTGFTFAFPPDLDAAHFSFCIPYVEKNLRQFLNDRPTIARSTLVKSEKGRDIELLSLRSGKGTFVVPICARAHACETMGSFVMEGMLDHWLSDDSDAAYLREHVTLEAIPFVDKDGVENGDQGKFRMPHDHNRDYIAEPRFAVTREIMRRLNEWSARIPILFDLHCPWIRGDRHEELFFVGIADPWNARLQNFCAQLQSHRRGPLPYHLEQNIPIDTEWNVSGMPMLNTYAQTHLPKIDFPATVEIPYAIAGGVTMTANRARDFGHDLAHTLSRYLQKR